MLLRLDGVAVSHAGGAQALAPLTLEIRAGEQVALIGPSGAGKTTLLHTLALAHKPAAGSLKLFGGDPWTLRHGARHALRKRLFLAPQTPPLPPRQRVVNAVLAARLPHWGFWRALASLIRPRNPRAAFEALEAFHLGDKLYSRVDRLSGGERQRASLARLLVSSSELFLVDEPLSALDPELSRVTLAALQREAYRRSAALVCSLHQVDLALSHFTRIVALKEGKLAFDLPRGQVSDAMIAALYGGEHVPVAGETAPAPVSLPHACMPVTGL
ncbi:MAG TPA: ATP-binding cassette domain-containing protein [Burkholderiaceae bacterium]